MTESANWSSIFRLSSITTTACGIAYFAADAALAKDPRYIYAPREYVRHARYSMTQMLEMQAAEARVLSQTMWNHHFEQDSEELRAAGRAQLDRLARKYPNGNFELSIQAAHDFRFTEGDVDAYFTHRKELDAARTKTVADYLQRVIPGIPVAVQIHDRPPIGLSGPEALRAYSQMVSKANVFIPDDSNGPQYMFGQGFSAGVFGGGGFGGGSYGASGLGGYGDSGLGSGLSSGGMMAPPSPGGAGPIDFPTPSLGSDTPTGSSGPPVTPSGPPVPTSPGPTTP